jgi:murein DD-endopeptidase MepM/ murein hydrolase activator NlpD
MRLVLGLGVLIVLAITGGTTGAAGETVGAPVAQSPPSSIAVPLPFPSLEPMRASVLATCDYPFVDQLEAEVAGLRMPIDDASLPSISHLMPNALRSYRYGIHEGVDFFGDYVGVPAGLGTPVLAAQSGTVTIATHTYQDLTFEEWEGILERSRKTGSTSEEDLHLLRGRQVEIDHGGGVKTRYAHLSAIAPSVEVGACVEVGQVIGLVGNSGDPDAIYDPNGPWSGPHLHFEVRARSSYLGAGLPPDETEALYRQAFHGR